MKIDAVAEKYPSLKAAIDVIKKIDGVDTLYPSQVEAINSGYLDGKSLILAIPTASGKTLCAELAMLKAVSEGKKALYLVPLKSLGSEKYEDFKRKYSPLGIKVGLSIGDLDSSDKWLSRYDIIVSSNEKCDSLLRHGIDWARDIGLVVADEIHLLNDPGRGPTLEMVLTRLMEYKPAILGLSATISNYKQIAEWLGAEARASDYRPVKLYKGVCHEDEVSFSPKRSIKLLGGDHVSSLVGHVLEKKKQALVFVSTRRSAEAAAEKLAGHVRESLSQDEAKALQEISKKVAGESATKQCYRLQKCFENGVAFHHAGLTAPQRKLVEENYRAGKLKVIAATPSLAAGVNTPSYMAIVRDIKRFQSVKGMDYISNMEVMQMLGRCGRPQYDTEGLGVVVAKSESEARYAWDNYVNGEPEKVSSKLGVEPVLRVHVLALVASGVCSSRKQLTDFFSRTFYAYQYGDIEAIAEKIDRIVALLEGFRFVKTTRPAEDTAAWKAQVGQPDWNQAEGNLQDGASMFKPAYFFQKSQADYGITATRIGKRVSELYIDPITANTVIQGLGYLQKGYTTFGLLHILCNTLEMKPLLSLRKKDIEIVNERMEQEASLLSRKPPNPWDIEYDDYAMSIKTAMFLESWMDESTEDQLLEGFGVTPGELRFRLANADWLLYSTQELGLLMGQMGLIKNIRKARLRVKYGIREELLPLVQLKGIGRVKARKLFASNVRSLAELRKMPMESLERIVGAATAQKVREQVDLSSNKSISGKA